MNQDTTLECIDEWAEPDEYGFDSTPPLHSSSALDYDPDEPYHTWNGDPEEMDMYCDEQQLEQTSHQEQEDNYDPKIYSWAEDERIKARQEAELAHAQALAALERISRSIRFNECESGKINPSIIFSGKASLQHNLEKTNTKKGKELVLDFLKQNNIGIDEQKTNKYPHLIFTKLGSIIQVVSPKYDCPNRKSTKWAAVNAGKWYPAVIYVVFNCSTMEIIGFAYPNQFDFYEKDPEESESRRWFDDTWRVPISELKHTNELVKHINKLFGPMSPPKTPSTNKPPKSLPLYLVEEEYHGPVNVDYIPSSQELSVISYNNAEKRKKENNK